MRGRIITTFIILFLSIATTIVTASEHVVIELKKDVCLSEDEFNLGDIAVVRSDDLALESMLNDMYLGSVPMVENRKRNITPAEIRHELQKHGLTDNDITFSGASISTVGPRLQTVEGSVIIEQVEGFIRATMPWDDNDIIIESLRDPEDIEVAEGNLSYEVIPISSVYYIGQVRYSVIVSVDAQVQKTVNVYLRVTVFKDVLVTSIPLKRGDLLTPQTVTIAKRELRTNTQDALTNPQDVMGMIAARNLPAQKIIKKEYIDMPVIVHRREMVKVIYPHPQFTIETVGVAKEDGALGEYIRVQNMDSNKLFFARIVGVRTVEVALQRN